MQRGNRFPALNYCRPCPQIWPKSCRLYCAFTVCILKDPMACKKGCCVSACEQWKPDSHAQDLIWRFSFVFTIWIGMSITSARAQSSLLSSSAFWDKFRQTRSILSYCLELILVMLLSLCWKWFHKSWWVFIPLLKWYIRQVNLRDTLRLTADSFLIHKNKQIARHMSELNSIYSVGTCKCNNTL